MDKLRKAGFDVEKGISAMKSEELYFRVVETFIRETGINLVMLEDAFEDENHGECERLLHTIKGGAAAVYHEGICARSLEMEELVKKKDIATAIKKSEQYMEYCSAVLVSI